MKEHERPRREHDVRDEAQREEQVAAQRRRREHEQEREHEDVDVVAVRAPVEQLHGERHQHEVDDGHEVGLGELARDDPRALHEHGAEEHARQREPPIEQRRPRAPCVYAPRDGDEPQEDERHRARDGARARQRRQGHEHEQIRHELVRGLELHADLRWREPSPSAGRTPGRT